MTQKRKILEALPKNDLIAFVDAYELDVADKRKKGLLVDALARSKKARLDDILGDMPRDQLKALCLALGLDDSGREKAKLIARLTGPAPSSQAELDFTQKPKKRGRKKASAKEASEEAVLPTGKLTVPALKNYLWSAADILRGSIDSSDYKNYIFGMLFLKRLSDRFEEEAEKLIAEGEDEHVAWTDPDEHRFFVPKKARWSVIQKKATEIGEALDTACRALEDQNTALERVLVGIDFNSERKLGNAKNRDTVLRARHAWAHLSRGRAVMSHSSR